jgi:hypothetical protein
VCFTASLGLDQTRRSHDRPDAPVQSSSVPRLTAVTTDRTRQLRPIQRPVQRPITPVTSFHLRFFAFDTVKNRRFTSIKAPNPNPFLPLKLHLLRKCANTTKCTSPCACVLAFSQSFSSKELATQLASPLDSSNDTKLDHSSYMTDMQTSLPLLIV